MLCKNERQLRYWQPYLERRTEPTLLLADFALPDDALEFPDCITALELGFLAHKAVEALCFLLADPQQKACLRTTLRTAQKNLFSTF